MQKKPKNGWKTLLFILFFIYLALFIACKTGYYQNTTRKDTLYTESQIQNFEADINNNVAIDTSRYLPEEPDYSNVFTKGANKLSNKLGKVINSHSKNIWEFLKTLFIA